MAKSAKWKSIKRTQIFNFEFVKIYKDKVRLPNGKIIHDYILIERPDVVTIVATTKENKVITIREYRHGVNSFQIALPAGFKETNETIIAAAKRELMEETGYGGGKFKYINFVYDDPSKTIRKFHIIRAKEVYRQGKSDLESTETITEVKPISIGELRRQVKTGKWHSAPSLAALLLSDIYLK